MKEYDINKYINTNTQRHKCTQIQTHAYTEKCTHNLITNKEVNLQIQR